jgi:hypothetical protein
MTASGLVREHPAIDDDARPLRHAATIAEACGSVN